MVPKEGKPIPVLIDISKHSAFIDRFVNLKARITVIPDELTKQLRTPYNDILSKHNENFYNPFAEVGSFICLSVIENNPDIKIEKDNSDIPNADAQVFAELHVEDLNLYPDVAKAIIEGSIPDLASPALKVMTIHGYEATPYLTKGNIRIIYKEPNIIGLYTVVKLFDNISYLETISSMSRYSQDLSRKIQNHSLEAVGKRLKTTTDFVFDPTKATLFDSRGILNVNVSNYPDLNNTDDKETINWYRSSQ
nr:hypothetical protein [Desulforamulus aquiferis]